MAERDRRHGSGKDHALLSVGDANLVVPIALQYTAAIRRAFERAAVQLAGERDGQIITLKLVDLSIPKIPSWR